MFKHVLLPTDGSKLSETAVRRGVQFAKSINARVTGCSVVPKLHFFNYDSDMPATIKEQAIQECKLQAENHLDFVRRTAKEAGVPCDTVCGTDDQPYEAIVDAAEKVVGPEGDLQKHRDAVKQLSSQALETQATVDTGTLGDDVADARAKARTAPALREPGCFSVSAPSSSGESGVLPLAINTRKTASTSEVWGVMKNPPPARK